MIRKLKRMLSFIETFENEKLDIQKRLQELESNAAKNKVKRKNRIFIDAVPDSQLEYVKERIASIPKEDNNE